MSVVIIGAGVAGLTVARFLSRSKVPVILLEGQDRVGGRVLTTAEGYDLGASWLHDSKHNVLYSVAQELKIPVTFDQDVFVRYNDGKRVSDKVIERADRLLELTMDAPFEESLHDWAIANTQTISDKNERTLIQKSIQAMEHWSGQSWYEMAAVGGGPHFSTPDAFNLAGNETIIRWLSSEIDWDYVQLRTNAPVCKIRQPESVYEIELESGEILSADYVVCTIAIGAMREFKPFDLRLPTPLRQVIETTTMATLGKVVFEFEERWWDDVPDRMEVFANVDPETFSPPAEPDQTCPAPGEHPVFFTNAYKSVSKPVIVALISGHLTQYVEAHPEKAFELLKSALEQIRPPGSQTPVPEPTNVVVTDWTRNRFFRGSYSGVTLGQDPEVLVEAFESGADNLRFAGEHTTEDGAGCMHGAYNSGKREAAWILDKLGKSTVSEESFSAVA